MIRYLFVLMAAWALAGPASAQMEPPPARQGATAYRMAVGGMACPFCAYNVEQRFNAMEGVQYVEVNLDKGRVVVVVGKGAELTRSRVAKLYKEAGFKLKDMKVVPLNRTNLANQ